uniref:laccase n=1 Tax=Crustodontia chrysocreas TaxID=2716695 RepID=A0A0N9H7N4_9APHY|nr:laccase [Crustodontia chrysocreas]
MRQSLSFKWVSMALAAVPCMAIGPVTDLVIVNKEVNPDGFTRQGVLAGGTLPGPVITGMKGDTFKINVVNQLTNATMLKSTSVHWHGITQHGSNWADGPAFVTQCPIASGNSFLYDFSVPDQAGTFWYHSHIHNQYCDGLRGAFIIYDPCDPFADMYDVDNEDTILTLADWYHVPAASVGFPPVVDSVLINGLGRSPGGPATPLSVITVQHGKRYRIRMLNLACDPNFVVTIDRHSMTVIEADGVNHEPITVDSIQIFAGQRYSFVLNANQPIGNYWIRAAPAYEGQTNLQGFAGGINSAVLRYVGAPDKEPTEYVSESVNPLQETNLHPLVDAAAPGKPYPGGADVVINLNLGADLETLRYLVNNVSFYPPTVPVLLQILSGTTPAQELLPGGSVYPLPRDSVIEVSIPLSGASIGGPHPFHLHGHTFSVVRSANSSTYNFKNPVQRDTVSIGGDPSDNVTIRFTTDNPGPWFLHCHIDWHLEAGLAIVFAEDVQDVRYADPVPEAWKELCPIYDALAPEDQ